MYIYMGLGFISIGMYVGFGVKGSGGSGLGPVEIRILCLKFRVVGFGAYGSGFWVRSGFGV